MALWLWSLSGKGLEPRGKLGGVLDCLPILNALNIAFIRVLVRGAKSDNPHGPSQLQLEGGVIGDHHELGISWASDDGMVGTSKTHYFKSEGVLPEVGRHAEIDW
jgi:hypothetical protein